MAIQSFMAMCAILGIVLLGTGIPAYRAQKIEIKGKNLIQTYTGNKAAVASSGYIISGSFAVGFFILALTDPDLLYGKIVPLGLLMLRPIVLGWLLAMIVEGEVIETERKPSKK